jgi:hypothetical protein
MLALMVAGAATCFGQNDEKKKYRLVVSFESECCGINHRAEDKFKKFIATEEHKNKVKLESTQTYWGKEGERDYCFELKELSKSKQKSFIRALRKLLAAYKLVQVKENAYCNPSNRF